MSVRILVGDSRTLPLRSETAQCCVTSPPFWGLRDYGHAGQIGLEATPEAYVSALVDVFREVRRVLKPDGVLWLNLGDCFAGAGGRHGGKGNERGQMKKHKTPDREIGLKPKDLIGIPWMVAFALRADGWWLRSDCIWDKPNCMPDSTEDRPTHSHEYVFLLSKSSKYYYDASAVMEASSSGKSSMRNRRTIWRIPTRPYTGAHFAVFPEALAELCILSASRPGDLVLDPFCGSGTTVAVAEKLSRKGLGVEVKTEYALLARERVSLSKAQGRLAL